GKRHLEKTIELTAIRESGVELKASNPAVFLAENQEEFLNYLERLDVALDSAIEDTALPKGGQPKRYLQLLCRRVLRALGELGLDTRIGVSYPAFRIVEFITTSLVPADLESGKDEQGEGGFIPSSEQIRAHLNREHKKLFTSV
ncbi:MAG: hypothetical protein KDD60_11845, partial [Bdellovibrionales bacterium]|nr:hypothetical protein [Bdellovibrionales bacterium]